MEYKIIFGWMFPSYESKLLEIDRQGNSVYRGLNQINESLRYVKKFDTFVDIGANVGLITVPMANVFKSVYAFECVEHTFNCLEHNTKKHSNVHVFNNAISNKNGILQVAIPKVNGQIISSGWASIYEERINEWPEKDYISVRSITIDELNLPSCDFIKIDVEGAEMMVVQGAIKTINKFKPVIQFENKRRESLNVINFLKKHRYVIAPYKRNVSKEMIMISGS